MENCNLFAHNSTAITFFEGITTVRQGGQTGLQFNLTRPECYHSVDSAVGYQQLLAVTGVQAEGQPTVVLGLSLDVFRLYLKEQEQ